MCDEAVDTTISLCKGDGGGSETAASGAKVPSEDKCTKVVRDDLEEEDKSVEDRTKQGSYGFTDDGSSSSRGKSEAGKLPEEPLLYALPYLSLKDILGVERVSKVCKQMVREDISLWRQLHVEPPLSAKLTGEALVQLAARSKGQLRSLILVNCFRIREGALDQVVCSNPHLFKLYIPGCDRISSDAVLRIVKKHSDQRSPGVSGLKKLRVPKFHIYSEEEYDMLLTILGDGEKAQCTRYKPLFYRFRHYAPSCDDDQRPIDVELCPRCSQVRSVYDCTREECQKQQGDELQQCHACIDCIGRCDECGKCEYDEFFYQGSCACFLCSSCWGRLPKCCDCDMPGCSRHMDASITTVGCYACK